MNKTHLESIVYSTGGIVALVVILIAANFIINALNLRIDLTQGSVYTLSAGTKAILSKLEAPVTIRYYYSQGGSALPVDLKTFAKRVEDLLGEYKRASHGKVIIEKLDPEPDSDAEDSAALDNVQAQLTNTQEKFYLGLATSFLDQKAALPVLAPDREQLLEYDITRAIAQVASATKPVVGVMSALPVLGRSLNPMTKQQPTEPWVLATELQSEFTAKKVELNIDRIPDDIKVLLVIHPRDLSEATEYALDQYVLRGGKLIAFLDSYAYFDQQPIEAQATISACIEAYHATNDMFWVAEARRAFEWFLGRNDLGLALYDAGTGGCRDGLHVDRLSQNEGAESTLAFLIALAEMQALQNSLTSFKESPGE